LQNLISIDFDTILPILPSKDNTEEKADKEITKNMVEKAMAKLDEKYREPLALFYLEEFSYEEISRIMSIPEATVGVRINRGKKKLREIYEKQIEKYERN
jgi:RNA polymerase sigma-70 factor (ECF subfamily)